MVEGFRFFILSSTQTTPFFYDPSLGNLLLDVRNFGGGATTYFDSVDEFSDGVSRVATFSEGNVTSSTADISDTTGPRNRLHACS